MPKRLFNLHVEFYEDDPTSNAATKPGATSSTDPELDKLEWLWGAFDQLSNLSALRRRRVVD